MTSFGALSGVVGDGFRGGARDNVDIGGGQGWPFEAMLNNLTATALGGESLIIIQPVWDPFN